jgi:hypothetical protein
MNPLNAERGQSRFATGRNAPLDQVSSGGQDATHDALLAASFIKPSESRIPPMSARTRAFASFSRRSVALLAISAAVSGSVFTATSAAAAPLRAALSGWVLLSERVQAYETDRLNVTVTNPRAFLVIGDGDTDLDCQLYQNGQLVDSDNDDTDVCLLSSRGRSGTFRITVRNNGAVFNDYVVQAKR